VTCEDDDEVAAMQKLTGKYVRLFVWTPLIQNQFLCLHYVFEIDD
jgi:hypothetical protein